MATDGIRSLVERCVEIVFDSSNTSFSWRFKLLLASYLAVHITAVSPKSHKLV